MTISTEPPGGPSWMMSPRVHRTASRIPSAIRMLARKSADTSGFLLRGTTRISNFWEIGRLPVTHIPELSHARRCHHQAFDALSSILLRSLGSAPRGAVWPDGRADAVCPERRDLRRGRAGRISIPGRFWRGADLSNAG